MPQNIYIVGAQCTGKTTLVAALSAHFTTSPTTEATTTTVTPAPLIITEVARTVLRQHNITASDIASSPSKALHLQELILAAQHAAERAAGTAWFIADRSGFDPIVYARRYVGDEQARRLLGTGTWGELRERMARSLVVVCEAGVEWLVDDGVRLMPVDGGDWRAFHELFCRGLGEQGVGFVVLPCGVRALEERVGFVLERWAGTAE